MSAQRKLSANAYMKKLTGEAIVRQFPEAFFEHPDLTPEIFYNILLSVNFDVRKAQLKVIELVRKPGDFILPADLLDANLPQSTGSPPNLQQEFQDKNHGSDSLKVTKQSRNIPWRSATPSNPVESVAFTTPQLKRRATLLKSPDGILEASRRVKRRKSDLKRNPLSFTSVVETISLNSVSASAKTTLFSPFSSVVGTTNSTSLTTSKRNPICGFIPDSERDGDEESLGSVERSTTRIRSISSNASFHTAESSQKAGLDESIIPAAEAKALIELTSGEHDGKEYEEDSKVIESTKSTPRSIKQEPFPDFGDDSDYDFPAADEELRDVDPAEWLETRIPKAGQRGKRVGANPNELVLKHRSKSLATPWLHTLARPFYPNKVDVLENYPYERGPEEVPDLEKHLEEVRTLVLEQSLQGDIDSVRCNPWGTNKPDGAHQDSYASVTIDGITYFPGDCVLIYSGSEDQYQVKRGRKKIQADPTEDDDIFIVEKDPWYGRIKFFQQEEATSIQYGGKKTAHIQWFHHASATIQGELACPNELFLASECSDEEVFCFASKIAVTYVSNIANEPGGIAEHSFGQGKGYFYRFHYDRVTRAFTDASIHDKHDHHMGLGPCEVCHMRITSANETGFVKILGTPKPKGPRVNIKGFHRGENDYFLYDFVYIFIDEKKIYEIGQITRIYANLQSYNKKTALIKEEKLLIEVDIYDRVDRFHKPWFEEFTNGAVPKVRDERRLYYTEINCPRDRARIMLNQLDGKCYVRHRDDITDMDRYRDKNDHFWVDQQVSELVDAGGDTKESDLVRLGREYMRYSDQSTIDAENEEIQNEDFSSNGKKLVAMDLFSGAGGLTVGMKLSNVVETRHAVEFSENFPDCIMHNADINLMLERAISRDSGEKLEPLYDYHEDPVEDLPARGMIDFIYGGCPCPGYSKAIGPFLASNISQLGAMQRKGKLRGGIESGTMKFILRALTSLGYQCHYALLQAAEHGVPSSRKRVFFWASLPGYPLPQFPQSQNLQASRRLERSEDANWYRKTRSTPHRQVTVGDAITDLPKFDWSHPKRENDGAITEDRMRRWKNGINQFEVVQNEDAIGLERQNYPTQPLSEYQRKMRIGVGMDNLMNHVTHQWQDHITILICEIPMVPGADHRDVANELKPRFLWHPDSAAAKNKFYPGRCGRLDMKEGFGTCLTDMYPISMNGKVVHPTQHRVISIVEYARLMSFPDSFVFELDGSRVADVIRQIGNAVPPFLAKAVGSGLAESVILKFEEDKTKNSIPNPRPKQAIKVEQSTTTKISTRKQKSLNGGRSADMAIYLD
ncbi:uncharacterized protein RAG0_05935 [Rhynchosporium agropyri]|uniref:DNA (cytosine-5-)-methyltransferase n=1 Tax=Rhynchosporium agropyri TaxID=914238 RepID=A0A1E1KIU2_9HELO|nr:uncharacterized protein RAG0_05935 [Rhynchosporium agropyri]